MKLLVVLFLLKLYACINLFNTLEFCKLYEFELEWYFDMFVCQLIKGTNHFNKFTVVTRG